MENRLTNSSREPSPSPLHHVNQLDGAKVAHGRELGRDLVDRVLIVGLTTHELAEFGVDDPRDEMRVVTAIERHLASYFASFGADLPPPGLYHRVLREIEHPLLSVTLAATRGNQIRAADLLGVNRNTLRKKIRDLDIQVFRSSG